MKYFQFCINLYNHLINILPLFLGLKFKRARPMSLFPYYSSKHIIGVNLHLLIEDISQLLIKKKDKHQVSDLYIVLEEKLL